jgi:hypothetical protein
VVSTYMVFHSMEVTALHLTHVGVIGNFCRSAAPPQAPWQRPYPLIVKKSSKTAGGRVPHTAIYNRSSLFLGKRRLMCSCRLGWWVSINRHTGFSIYPQPPAASIHSLEQADKHKKSRLRITEDMLASKKSKVKIQPQKQRQRQRATWEEMDV